MDRKDFEEAEDKFQAQYDIKPPFEPIVVISIKLIRFTSGLSTDVAHPQFRVTCPKIVDEHLRQFVTTRASDDKTEGEINEKFKFVIPKHMEADAKDFLIIFELISDSSVIGKCEFEASTLEMKTNLYTTFIFEKHGKNRGEIEVQMRKSLSTTPDFRYSLGLCSEEKTFRKKRIALVQEAMKKLLGEEKGPRGFQETPVVSLVCSGGGYRAVTGMCGAMEALKDAGLLDIITYNSGLSGSAWYLTAAYGKRGLTPENQAEFHKEIRRKFSENLLTDVINSKTFREYRNYIDKELDSYGVPHTLVNYFPGFLVGRQLLGEKKEDSLNSLIPYVDSGEVPFPILVAIHVKDKVIAGDFHAYLERTPYEIYMPSYGIGIDPTSEGSTWSKGVLLRKCVKYPLHFTIGMTGCAFSVLPKNFLKYGKELKSFVWSRVDHVGVTEKSNCNSISNDEDSTLNIESEDEEEKESGSVFNFTKEDASAYCVIDDLCESIDDVRSVKFDEAVEPNVKDNKKTFCVPLVPSSPKTPELPAPIQWFSDSSLFTSRNGIVQRTARLHNLVYGLDSIKRYDLNPLRIRSKTCPNRNIQKILSKFGCNPSKQKISTTKKLHSFVDAGILKNVSTEAVLRPQRTTDVLIVMDFNAYESDNSFDYDPLLKAAAHSWQFGLKFPEIDFEAIKELPPKEFLAFPGDGDGRPTVLWFTLSNKRFRGDMNYRPRSHKKPPSGERREFNDFDVFGEDTFSSTFTFHYSKYNFDQLRELMYYNVSRHIEDIKNALAEATKLKRERLEREGVNMKTT